MTAGPGQMALVDRSTSRPAPARGPVTELVRWICLAYLKANGWRLRGDWPAIDRMVLVAAPHTSNWDGLNMLAAAGAYRIKLRWMGKKSLTKGPFGWLILALGCVPIDRSGGQDLVRQMSDQFAAHDRMVLAIAPEGTRAHVAEWKSGFYHIANAAGVPIVMSVLDYGAKTLGIAAILQPGGDYEADLALIRSCYVGVEGKHRQKFAG